MSQKSDHFRKNVLFSDETMIELFPKRRNFVRRPKQSRSLQKYVGQHAKLGGKKMFWGFIKESGERKLIKVENRVNSSVYTNILASHLLPLMYLGELLQQDNAPAHKSAETSHGFSKTVSTVFLKTGPQTRQILSKICGLF